MRGLLDSLVEKWDVHLTNVGTKWGTMAGLIVLVSDVLKRANVEWTQENLSTDCIVKAGFFVYLICGRGNLKRPRFKLGLSPEDGCK